MAAQKARAFWRNMAIGILCFSGILSYLFILKTDSAFVPLQQSNEKLNQENAALQAKIQSLNKQIESSQEANLEMKKQNEQLEQKIQNSESQESVHWGKIKTDGELTRIFKETGTDKLHNHHYERWYETFFQPYRHNKVNFLEIGAHNGQSMKSWAMFFKEASLIQGVRYGNSIDSQKLACEAIGLTSPCAQVKIVDGSSNDPVFLNKLAAQESWDIIIDDGAHVPEHQIRAFVHLFPSVAPGGLYVVEDIETSYWKHPGNIYNQRFENSGIGKDAPGNLMSIFFDMVHINNRKYFTDQDSFVLDPKIDYEIASIMFVPNAILIFKKDKEFGTIGRPLSNANKANKDLRDYVIQRQKVLEPLKLPIQSNE